MGGGEAGPWHQAGWGDRGELGTGTEGTERGEKFGRASGASQGEEAEPRTQIWGRPARVGCGGDRASFHPRLHPLPLALSSHYRGADCSPSPSPGSQHSWGPATSAASARSTAGCAQSRAPQSTTWGRGGGQGEPRPPETDTLTPLPTDTDSWRRSYTHRHTGSIVRGDGRTDKHAITLPRPPPSPLPPPPPLPSLQAPLRRPGHL